MVLDIFSLKDQVGIVTVGGQGLGKAFSLAYADAGADIVVADINAETGPRTIDEIKVKGRQALFVETDIRQRESIQYMVGQTIKEFGKIS